VCQHDEKTLLPAGARTYELPSFSGAESVGIIKLLMEISIHHEIIASVQELLNARSHRIKIQGGIFSPTVKDKETDALFLYKSRRYMGKVL